MRRLLPLALILTTTGAAQRDPAAAVISPTDRAPGTATLSPDTETRWVPFDLTPGNQIRFTMAVDGRDLTAILDTGVSFSVLSRAAADPAKVQSGGTATAIGGSVAIGWLPTATLSLGGLTRTGGGLTVTTLPATATGSARAVDLLLGRDVLAPYALDIDYAARRFRLLRSGRMPYRGAIAPLAVSAARNVYESAITLGGHRVRPMVVDTGDGASVSVTDRAWNAHAPAGLPVTTTIAFGLAGEQTSRLAIVPTIGLGTLVARQVEVRIEAADGFSQSIGTAGRIGSGLLQHYRVLLDPTAGRMILRPGPTADTPPLRSTSGLLLGILPDRLRVLHVMRGGPAAATGWKDGDTICAIDGMPVTADYATSPLAAWSAGKPGRVVTLTLCDGTTRQLTLKRFY
ncbi:hypothetical protein ASE75_12065 [Sphingomonas sp. Leaf17]|uniref:aspartyl protease family protein n=1 Tax=Sphingomonas sp. Leaf17 TaxID=1735683 RepID=UPI0006FD932F|nr:aspartyl protease family protein [Sphingomonas sp. Leaf17]KQM63210.1 hypothetical protein ASE75_12065 [Sphingomonas sp. Leaf17]